MRDLETLLIHGVFAEDPTGSLCLTELFLEEQDAKDEIDRRQPEKVAVKQVAVFVPKEGGWRKIFRQREGRSE